MNKETLVGFVKRAQEAGIPVAEATKLFKQATGMDPAAMMAQGDPSQGGPPPGAGGPPPGHPHHGHPGHGGGDPAAMGGGAGGVPPELEQLISQLPPEVLAQLVQEIEAEMQHGGQGGAGGPPPGAGGPPPGAGGPPPGDPSGGMGGPPPGMDPSMGKQGSVKILAKEAAYVEGFVERGLGYGFSRQDVKEMYKKAVAIMDPKPQQVVAQTPKLSDKQASHYEGFMTQARGYGISDNEAADVYRRTFSK